MDLPNKEWDLGNNKGFVKIENNKTVPNKRQMSIFIINPI